MRVLYIDSVCKSGSTGKIVYALYTAVNENGGEAASTAAAARIPPEEFK